MALDGAPRTPSAPGTPQIGALSEGVEGNPPPFPLYAEMSRSAIGSGGGGSGKGADAAAIAKPGEVAIDSVFSIEGIGIVVAVSRH